MDAGGGYRLVAGTAMPPLLLDDDEAVAVTVGLATAAGHPVQASGKHRCELQARTALHDLLAPDGYLLGWNQGGVLHPHMHVIPRFDDEPLSDRWLRSAVNVPENRRPGPWAPGSGRALRGAR